MWIFASNLFEALDDFMQISSQYGITIRVKLLVETGNWNIARSFKALAVLSLSLAPADFVSVAINRRYQCVHSAIVVA